MAKKRTAANEDTADQKTAPAVKGEVVFVNSDKLARAQVIVALVSGKRVPKDTGEEEQKEKFSGICAEAHVNPKDESALQFIYEKLGGLVRTPAEQEDADEKAAEARAKAKKRAIDSEVRDEKSRRDRDDK